MSDDPIMDEWIDCLACHYVIQEAESIVSEYCQTVWDHLLGSEETAESDTWRFLNGLDGPTESDLEELESEEHREEE